MSLNQLASPKGPTAPAGGRPPQFDNHWSIWTGVNAFIMLLQTQIKAIKPKPHKPKTLK
jgi:hypothetical protein